MNGRRTRRRLALVTGFAATLAVIGPAQAIAPGAPTEAAAPAPRSVGADNWHDFDNDGFHDLAIGLPNEDVGAVTNAGAVQVIYSSDEDGLTQRDQFWTQDSAPSGYPAVPDSAETGDRFGAALAYGDFNNDGYGDLAVGAPGEDVGSTVDAGVVHLFYGSATGLRTSLPGQPAGFISFPGAVDEGAPLQIGAALVALDAYPAPNGDGYADIAIGFPGVDYLVMRHAPALSSTPGSARGTTILDTGGVLTWRGTVDGIVTAPGRGATSGQDTNSFSICGEPTAGDRCGSVLAAGDFGNGGIDDLAMGTPVHDFTGKADAGAIWVDYDPFDSDSVVVMYAQGGGGVRDTREAGDRFGSSLAAGDLTDLDGYDELAVGVPFEDVTVGTAQRVDAGIVQTFRGTVTGLSANPVQLFSQDSAESAGGGGVSSIADLVEAGDRFGHAVAVGNMGRSNDADLAIGVPFEDLNGKADVGAVHVLFGGDGGVRIAQSQFFRQGQGGMSGVQAVGDRFGSALAALELGHNSYPDLVIGVPFEDVVRSGTTYADAGAIHALYGSLNNGLDVMLEEYLTQDSMGIADAAETGDRFGGVLR